MRATDLAGPDPNPMSVNEVEALQKLVRHYIAGPRPISVIQIGAERGCSTLAMIEAEPKIFVLSIDIGERPEEFRNIQAAGLDGSKVARLLGRSQEAGQHWPAHWKADLVYIDGDHRYDGALHDIGLWSHAVKPGGILALHDYIDPQERAPHIVGRVWEAVQDHLTTGVLHPSLGWEDLLHVERLIAFRRRNP